jgi:hypothetical protein
LLRVEEEEEEEEEDEEGGGGEVMLPELPALTEREMGVCDGGGGLENEWCATGVGLLYSSSDAALL